MLVIFDLDGTLIDSYYEEDAPDSEGMTVCIPDSTVKFRCYIRPNALVELLELRSKGHEVAIWSAGVSAYVHACANALASCLAPNPWKFVWSRDDMCATFKSLYRVLSAFPDVGRRDILFVDNQFDQTEPNHVLGFRAKLVPTFSIENSTILPPMIDNVILESG